MQRGGDVLERSDEHPVAEATLRCHADRVHETIQAAESGRQLRRRGFDLLGIGHVEFDDLTDLAELGELARGALG